VIRAGKLWEILEEPTKAVSKWGKPFLAATGGFSQPRLKAEGRRIAPPAFAISIVAPCYWAGVCEMSDTSTETPGPIVEEIAIFLT